MVLPTAVCIITIKIAIKSRSVFKIWFGVNKYWDWGKSVPEKRKKPKIQHKANMHLALELGQKTFWATPTTPDLETGLVFFLYGSPPGEEHALPKRKISCNIFYLGKEEDFAFFGLNKGTAITVTLKYYILWPSTAQDITLTTSYQGHSGIS